MTERKYLLERKTITGWELVGIVTLRDALLAPNRDGVIKVTLLDAK